MARGILRRGFSASPKVMAISSVPKNAYEALIRTAIEAKNCPVVPSNQKCQSWD